MICALRVLGYDPVTQADQLRRLIGSQLQAFRASQSRGAKLGAVTEVGDGEAVAATGRGRSVRSSGAGESRYLFPAAASVAGNTPGRGRTNAEIAGELFVGEGTVKTHANHLLAKLYLRDRAAAVVFAFDHDLVVAIPEHGAPASVERAEARR